MRKALRETQTLRAGCSKVESKIFATPQTPFPGVQDGQNFISWRCSLPSPTDPVWWGSMHVISSYRGNRPTNKKTHRQTGPIIIHYAAASPACNVTSEEFFLPFVLHSGLAFQHVRRILYEEIPGLRDQQLKRKVVGNLGQQAVYKRHLTDTWQYVLLTIQNDLQQTDHQCHQHTTVSWLFNSTFSTNRLYCAIRNLSHN